MNLYESIKKNLKESVKVGPIYRLGTEDYITSYNDIRLDEVGITLEDIELFKRVDTSESAPDKVNYLLYVDMRWDGDDTMTVPVAYNISDNEYEEEINPPMLGIYDEDLDSEVYNAVDEVVRNLALKISQSGRLTESTETRLANLGVKGKKPELKTVVLDGKEMMDYLKNDMEGKFPEFEKQITDDDHMIYFLTDLDKGKWDFDKMRIEEKVDSICPVCGDHHRFVKEENGKIYYSCPLCKYDEDKDNIYESEKLKEAEEDIDRFAKNLETALLDDGFKVHTDDYRVFTVSAYNKYTDIEIYEADDINNMFEGTTSIGIGGDYGDESINLIAAPGWEKETAGTNKVYSLFKELSKTTPDEVANIVLVSFKQTYNLNEAAKVNRKIGKLHK